MRGNRSVAGGIRGAPSDVAETENLGKGKPRGDPGAHSGRSEAVRRVGHTWRRFGAIHLSTFPYARAGLTVTTPRHTESTTIALLAHLSGLMEPLREFVKTKSVWGTCAGAILLSQVVSNPKKGGQELLGGVSVKITRNGWGSQVRLSPSAPPFCVWVGARRRKWLIVNDTKMHKGRIFRSAAGGKPPPRRRHPLRGDFHSRSCKKNYVLLVLPRLRSCSGSCASSSTQKGHYGTPPGSAPRATHRSHLSHSRIVAPASHDHDHDHDATRRHRRRHRPNCGRAPSRAASVDDFPPRTHWRPPIPRILRAGMCHPFPGFLISARGHETTNSRAEFRNLGHLLGGRGEVLYPNNHRIAMGVLTTNRSNRNRAGFATGCKLPCPSTRVHGFVILCRRMDDPQVGQRLGLFLRVREAKTEPRREERLEFYRRETDSPGHCHLGDEGGYYARARLNACKILR
jgi:hypothetical protein